MRDARTIGIKVAGLLAATALMISCLKTEEFPDEPHLEFKQFDLFTGSDSASLVVKFTDGDGDIGLAPGDTFPPYDVAPYYCNLFIEYFEFQNGAWVNVDLGGDPYICTRVPVITPTGQNKTLEGEIAFAMKYFSYFHLPTADTIKYSVKLADRALHESNVVETGTIILP